MLSIKLMMKEELRWYLDDISQLLQSLFKPGFHTLQVLWFDDLLLNPRSSCFHHHLQEVLLLRGKTTTTTTTTTWFYIVFKVPLHSVSTIFFCLIRVCHLRAVFTKSEIQMYSGHATTTDPTTVHYCWHISAGKQSSTQHQQRAAAPTWSSTFYFIFFLLRDQPRFFFLSMWGKPCKSNDYS